MLCKENVGNEKDFQGKGVGAVKVGAYMAAIRSLERPKSQKGPDRRFAEGNYLQTAERDRTWTMQNSRLGELKSAGDEEKADGDLEEEEGTEDRSEALKIVQAVMSGGKNPIEELRKPSKVPYGHLAKDGVIIYNGVCFVCDERTNSICLGDMTDEKNVLNIPLSGGGHLKVNRASLGLLSKAVGMFSPEDLNLIMRAIALDTKLQATEKEIEDTEASIGNQLQEEGEETEGIEEPEEGSSQLISEGTGKEEEK